MLILAALIPFSDRLADNLQKETVLITYLNDISQFLMLENRTNILIHIRTKLFDNLIPNENDI